jgi:hypothetical protein
MHHKDTLNRTFLLDNYVQEIDRLLKANLIAEEQVALETKNYINNDLLNKLNASKPSWKDFTAFWPPRIVDASRRNQVVIFFGAGLSLSSGLPSWTQLLTDNFNLDKSLIEDEELQSDPLTLAELAGHYLGSENLQSILRSIMNKPTRYSINHVAIAALRCPFYVTTNYDCLFEQAWKEINGKESLITVVNDADMRSTAFQEATSCGISVLFKIHGSSDRLDEHLILTRRDYRYHYRTNEKLFEQIRHHLREKHTLFVGFSHKDPEVSRLVEDAIYEYEQEIRQDKQNKSYNINMIHPQFYSLQFDMRAYTPEVFAARGIVALTPPIVPIAIDNIRAYSLSIALTDLIGAKERNLHAEVSLDSELRKAVDEISQPLRNGIQIISSRQEEAKSLLAKESAGNWLSTLCSELGELASQGIYLLDDQGNVVAYEVPEGLNKNARLPKVAFNRRPYFQQAKSFREPFISDTTSSIYNKNTTFFLCVPILEDAKMVGLLFSASQIGQWKAPILVAEKFWQKDTSFVLIDSNGVCLLPPTNEFPLNDTSVDGAREKRGNNSGYSYSKLQVLSRRDMLIRHISKSVVPIAQDDDVLNLSSDLRQFTIVTEVPDTRWKIGVSIPIGL